VERLRRGLAVLDPVVIDIQGDIGLGLTPGRDDHHRRHQHPPPAPTRHCIPPFRIDLSRVSYVERSVRPGLTLDPVHESLVAALGLRERLRAWIPTIAPPRIEPVKENQKPLSVFLALVI